MHRLAALALSGVILAGCNLAPRYKVPTIAVPVSYRDTVIWRTAAPADTAPPSDWWQGFGDPVLDKLEDDLGAHNFTLVAASAIFAQARADAAEAEAGLLPMVTLGGDVNRTSYPADSILKLHGLPSDVILRNNLVGGAGYEIDFWDRIHNEVAAGKAAAQASAADLAFIRLSLQAELANAYLLLRGLDAEQDLLKHTVTAYERALQVAQDRFNGQIASGMDVSRAQAQLESARAQLDDVGARRALAEHAIATLVAVPAPEFSIAPSLIPLHLPPLPPSVPTLLLQRRPDIAAAERRVAEANAMIGVARAAFFPNVSLNALGGFQGAAIHFLNLPSTFWSLGPGVTLPVFEGGLLRAQEAATIAAFNGATADYRNTVLGAFQNVEDALAQLHYYGVEETDDRRAIAAAQRTLQMSLALYQDGAANFLEVVVAQESLLGAQLLLLQLQTQYLQAGVGLVRALGGGWSAQDLPNPNEIPLRHVDIAQ